MTKMNKKMEALIEKNMKALGISYEEAQALVEDDMAIDRGERLAWEPTVEEEKKMRKAAKIVGQRKQAETPVKRERKADTVKRDIIAILQKALESNVLIDEMEVTNVERVIALKVGDDNFEITLSRKNKNKSKK